MPRNCIFTVRFSLLSSNNAYMQLSKTFQANKFLQIHVQSFLPMLVNSHCDACTNLTNRLILFPRTLLTGSLSTLSQSCPAVQPKNDYTHPRPVILLYQICSILLSSSQRIIYKQTHNSAAQFCDQVRATQSFITVAATFH